MVIFVEKEPKLGELEASGNRHLDGICRRIGSNITFLEFPRIDTRKITQASIAIAWEKTSISGFSKMNYGLPSHTTCLKAIHQLDMDEMIRQSTLIRNSIQHVIPDGYVTIFDGGIFLSWVFSNEHQTYVSKVSSNAIGFFTDPYWIGIVGHLFW